MTNDDVNGENWPQPEGLWLKIPHPALLFARLTRYQSVWNRLACQPRRGEAQGCAEHPTLSAPCL